MSGEGGADLPPAERATDEPDRADAGDEQERAASAARTALQRARAAAAARGLRPGQRARSQRAASRSEVTRDAGSDDRDPQAIRAGLERLVADRGWQVDVAVGGVMGRWARVVGPEVAAHCVPVTYEDAVLVVRADSTAWATQVRLLVPTLLRRLAEELGEGVVQQVQVRGPAAPSWRKGSRRVHGRGPRDTYG